MSLRRLADDTLQPPAFSFSRENARWAEGRVALYPEGRQQSAVIPLLMRAQEQEGWVTRAAMEAVATMLDMPYIRVLEVATFYTQFQLNPVGSRAHVQVCGTTPCMLSGAEALRAVCQERIHPDPFARNEDGTLSWEEVECLGACVNAPMVAIGKDTFEDLTPIRLAQIIDAFAAGEGASVPTGPQNGRRYSAPVSGRTTLIDKPDAERETALPPAESASQPGAAPQEPTTKARPRDVQEEQAPAFKGPAPQAKVSEGKAEAERGRAAAAAGADGQPNAAMREDATGAESAAGKIDGGAAAGETMSGGHAAGALSAGTNPDQADGSAASQGARADVDTKQANSADAARATAPGGSAVTSADADKAAPTREHGGGAERGAESVAGVDGNGKPEEGA